MTWKLFLDICTAIGSIGTFGAFIFLFFKDRQKQDQINELKNLSCSQISVIGELAKISKSQTKQINHLSSLADSLNSHVNISEDRLKLSSAPTLNFSIASGSTLSQTVVIKNLAQACKILEIKATTGEHEINQASLPSVISIGGEYRFSYKYFGQQRGIRVPANIKIIFEDFIGYKSVYEITANERNVVIKNKYFIDSGANN